MKLPSTRRTRPTLQMPRFLPFFVLPALLLAIAITPLYAQDANDGLLRRGPGARGQRTLQPSQPTPQQSALPPTQPTTLPPPAPAPQPIPPALVSGTPEVLNAPPTHRALVIFANGQLEVRADNSSLLQVLHDIHRLTGMNIIGGVAEQHIFGDYGPAAPSTVLATLLDGTGTNMLLRQDPVTGTPVELELTQRAGGAPPQSPMGPGFDDSPFPNQAAVPAQPAPQRQPQPAVNQPQLAPAVNAVNATPASTNTPPATPLKGQATTPESVYQQLLQMQAARAKATPAAPATPPPATKPPQ